VCLSYVRGEPDAGDGSEETPHVQILHPGTSVHIGECGSLGEGDSDQPSEVLRALGEESLVVGGGEVG
jgi:hypothetical protein